MIEAARIIASVAAGAVLGLVFFGGLWLTIRDLGHTMRPAKRMLASILLRFAVVIGGFYLLARIGGWPHVLAGAAGFTVARFVVIRATERRALPPGDISAADREGDR